MKQQIEIDVPEGFRIAKVEQINVGVGVTVMLEPIPEPEPPKTKRRPPTKHDLLGVDSLPCWVRDYETQEWLLRTLVAVRSDYGGVPTFFTEGNRYRLAEIEVPADEQPLLERWMNAGPDGSTCTYRTEACARAYTSGAERIIHMIEVRP